MKTYNTQIGIGLVMLACMVGLGIGAEFAQGQQRRPVGEMLDRIKANDKNGDGKITKEEAGDQLKRFF